jgi:hypothetical protein
MMRRLALPTLALLLGCAAAAPAAAQMPSVDAALERVAAAWGRGDAAAVAAHAAAGGVAVQVGVGSPAPLGARQASAVLRRLFDDRETVALRTGMTRVVGGRPARAFGEFAWTTRVRGTTVPERATVFIAFVLEDDGWRITQVRMRP